MGGRIDLYFQVEQLIVVDTYKGCSVLGAETFHPPHIELWSDL
jgi:hypothetical protein